MADHGLKMCIMRGIIFYSMSLSSLQINYVHICHNAKQNNIFCYIFDDKTNNLENTNIE